ncbi:protein cortex [Culicoides brevitarsis]|uniref:protein cortex n=1 Tax=Culicoides brevitarsis TaxID=469753 RepID=UPI00307BE986
MLRSRNMNIDTKKQSDKKRIPISYVMKRKNERINEVISVPDVETFIPRNYGDRFIPRRYSGFADINVDTIRAKWIHQDILRMRTKKGYWRRYKMDPLLCVAFDVDLSEAHSSVLKFNDTFCHAKLLKEPSFHNLFRKDWPCQPRNRPLAFVEAIHDLPRLKKTVGRQLIDWSAKNEIAAILTNKLVIWQLFTEKTIAYLMNDTKAVVYDSSGDFLALATRCNGDAVIHIWDTSIQDKRFRIHNEQLSAYPELVDDEVSCMAWNASMKIFCGTDNGSLFVFDFNDNKIKSIQKGIHPGHLVSLKFSHQYRYLASCDDSHMIRIWYCEGIHLQPKYCLKRHAPIYFDFHPWKVHEMVIGVEKPAELFIFNIATQEIVALYKQYAGCYNVRIHEVSFSKVTAELLLCLWYREEEKNKILVLSAMDQVVDVLEAHEDPVHNVVWSPDGKVLGTASDDQTFVLWNFFGLPAIEDLPSLQRIHTPPKTRLRKWTYEGKSAFQTSIR